MASLEGMQRLDLVNRTALAIAPISAVVLVILLERGWGSFGVALNGAVFSLLQVLIFALLLRGTGHPLTLRPSARRPGELARLVRFGWKLEANQLLLQLFRSDRLLLSATGLGVALVGVYQIGANVAERLGSTVRTLSSVVLPAASDLAARGDRVRLTLLLMKSTKYHSLAVAGLLGFAALFAPELLLLWLGQPMPEAVTVLRLLVAGSAVYSIVSPLQGMAVALGRPGLVLRGTLAGLAGAAVLYTIMGRRYDYGGLAGSVAAGTILSQAVFMIGFHGLLEFRWREWVGNAFLKPLAVIAPLLLVCGVWRLAAPHLWSVAGRGQALALLAPAFLLSAGLAWGLSRIFGIVDDYDVDVLKSLGRPSSA
jgi:O-antigen/teichoic acid export membrane protein